MATASPALCRNGPGCSYLARGRCSYRHPRLERMERMEDKVNNPFAFVFIDSLFNVMEKGSEDDAALAGEEILRRIEKRDVKECLNVLQETVRIQRQNRRCNELQGKALEVMTRSYSYFNETLWEDLATKDLNFEAFKKLCSAAKKAKPSWDKSQYGGVTDSEDSNSEDEYGQLDSMQEDFKAILRWVQREDIEERRRDLVLAVFKNAQRKSKASVVFWMVSKIENWERMEKEEEDEDNMEKEEDEDYMEDDDYMKSGIPGPYGARLDERFKTLNDLTEEGHSVEEFNKKLKRLLKQFEEEDEDGLYEKHLEEQFERDSRLISILKQLQ